MGPREPGATLSASMMTVATARPMRLILRRIWPTTDAMIEPSHDGASSLEGHVFISYAGPDADKAAALAVAVEQAGAGAWIDTRDLQPGDLWDQAIPEALRASSRVAVLVTSSWVESWYAPDEVGRAIAFARKHGLKRHIIPVLYGDIDAERLPYGLFNIVPLRVKGDDWAAAGERLASPTRLPLRPLGQRLARRRMPLIAAAIAMAVGIAGWAYSRSHPPDWPGDAPIEVALKSSTLRVDANEITGSDLGGCHLPVVPEGQDAWCAALREVIDPAKITTAVIQGRGGARDRVVTGLDPATAEAICALRGMRLPTDDEFMELAGLGEPGWPETPTVATVIAADVRGPQQRLRELSTGAVEWVRFGGGYLGRGTPMLSGDAVTNITNNPGKLLGDLTRPEKHEPDGTHADFGFRCVMDAP